MGILNRLWLMPMPLTPAGAETSLIKFDGNALDQTLSVPDRKYALCPNQDVPRHFLMPYLD